MDTSFFLCSSVDGHLSGFHFFGYGEECHHAQPCVIRFHVDVCFVSRGFMPRSGIAGPHGNSVSKLLRPSWVFNEGLTAPRQLHDFGLAT